MKLRQLVAIVVAIAAIASCTQKKATLSEQLTGKWSGTDSVELTMIDSLSNTVIQEFGAPIEIEYLADSTFTAVVTISEGQVIKMGGVASFRDSVALLKGTLSGIVMMDLNGQMSLNQDATMNFKYTAENPAEGLFQRGVVIATRANN